MHLFLELKCASVSVELHGTKRKKGGSGPSGCSRTSSTSPLQPLHASSNNPEPDELGNEDATFEKEHVETLNAHGEEEGESDEREMIGLVSSTSTSSPSSNVENVSSSHLAVIFPSSSPPFDHLLSIITIITLVITNSPLQQAAAIAPLSRFSGDPELPATSGRWLKSNLYLMHEQDNMNRTLL
ncbi:phosphate import ATP-binding protein pstB [Striga asiatica]|uniref:Phosphate import ATP-binding protein pstB n=1 Tax=Striga asiatica TaxID=4170 RepID=A0A5A7Q7V1_STRAF|nr:phosphate import ATP-binding protein pstB [Striga asiatica]